jgi:leucyl-tRNA synthetase
MYMLFMGPPELDCEWQDTGLDGIKRFLNRVWEYSNNPENVLAGETEPLVATKRVHKFICEFQQRLDRFRPNTAISAAMELFNDLIAHKWPLSQKLFEMIFVTLSTMAPHISSELLKRVCNKKLDECKWPDFNPTLVLDEAVTVVVQVNGKLRARLEVPRGAPQAAVEEQARLAVTQWLAGKEILKIVFVEDKLLSFVIR